MATYELTTLSRLAAADPTALIEEGCAQYAAALHDAAAQIAARLPLSPIVLISGPSSSGKTPSATQITVELGKMGIRAHRISMDDYYLDRDGKDFPRLPDGSFDLESPYGLDLPLLYAHLEAMAHAEPVDVPRFDFPSHRRAPGEFQHVDIRPGDAVIIEGIHALNTLLTDRQPNATRVYISVQSDFTLDGETALPRTWVRFLRRAMRDRTYRACPVLHTLELWGNVLAGEAAHIAPFAAGAHIQIDTTHAFEPCVLLPYARRELEGLPADVPHREMIDAILRVAGRVAPIDAALLPADSLLRTEFVEI